VYEDVAEEVGDENDASVDEATRIPLAFVQCLREGAEKAAMEMGGG